MNEIGKPFDDINSYNKSMSEAMKDKLFFVDKLPKDERYLFIDFGCADGTMIKQLIQIYREYNNTDCKYIGYDCSDTMISLAKTNFDIDTVPGEEVYFTSSWNEVESLMRAFGYTKKVIILSSVIHEVYSYAKPGDIDTFWERVRKSSVDYIVIRDMMARNSMLRPVDKDSITKLRAKCNESDSKKQLLEDFESVHGYITTQEDMIHFLLKYRWTINWSRELNENYFPVLLEDILGILKEPPYQLQYLENFKIKFLEDKIKSDFDIEFPDNTHIKLIFKRI